MTSISITRQLALAFQKENRLATTIAGLMGSFVPLGVYATTHALPIVHGKDGIGIQFVILSILALAGCVFSAKSVFQWGRLVFNDTYKAVGFAILLEGFLSASAILPDFLFFQVLGMVALAYLVLINAINCGTNMILQNKEYLREARAAKKSVKRK
jgi:hypothetical protein